MSVKTREILFATETAGMLVLNYVWSWRDTGQEREMESM